MLAALLAEPGVEEVCALRSRVGLMAVHGGSLEAMTDVIAEQAADVAGASLYAIRQPRTLRWHIPSNRLDPRESPALRAFLDHVDVAIAVHGWGTDGMWRDPRPSVVYGAGPVGSPNARDRPLLCGGRNRTLAGAVADTLRAALPGYHVVDDIDAIPPAIRGLDRRNIVNRPRAQGVQLELPPRVRGLPPFWPRERWGRECPDVRRLVAGLAEAAASA